MLTSGAISGPLTSLEMTEPTMYIPRSHLKYTFSFAVATALAILAGCSEKMVSPPPGVAASNGAAAQGPSGNAPKQAPGQPNAQPTATPAGGPVTVTAEKAQLRDMPVVLKTTGTVISLASVDVRSQVSSTVTKVHIQEGQFVKAGDVLFTLDSRSDDANVAKARAQMTKDAAALADARRQLVRAQQLLAQNFISQGALDTSLAQVEAQSAVIVADQAAIDAARVAQSYARIVAQNSGRAGAISVSAGSAVQANVTPLVTITQLNPIAVAYSLPQNNLPDALAALKGGGAAVVASLANGAGTFNGHVSFVDNTVDASSGAVKLKAVFDNHASQLWPGAFVEIAQTVSTLKAAVVIPQAAIIQTARGTIVYVNEQGKAALKPVKLLFAQGEDAVVTGVQVGDSVVMDGKQNLKPGVPVLERTKVANTETRSAKPTATP